MGGKRAGSVEEETKKHPGVEIHGKALRITFTHNGERCRETLSIDLTISNIKYAVQKRAAIQHEIRMGTFDYGAHFPESPKARGSQAGRNVTVRELHARYWPIKISNITEMTERRYRPALKTCCEVIGWDLPVSTLMPEDADRLRANLIATRKPSTVNNYLATWNGMAEWARKNGYTDVDLIAGFYKNVPSDPDPLTVDEFRAVVGVGCLHPQDVALITLAVYTGLRPGELCGLAREDVVGSRLTVSRSVTESRSIKVTKTGSPRTIWLVPPALDAVNALLAMTTDGEAVEETIEISRHQSRLETITPLVTPLQAKNKRDAGRRLYPGSWGAKWKNILRRAGVRWRVSYQTRHTYACWSLTAHGNIAYIAKQMGHKDFSMLVKVYGRWMDSESQGEADFIWQEMQKSGAFAPTMPQRIEGEPDK